MSRELKQLVVAARRIARLENQCQFIADNRITEVPPLAGKYARVSPLGSVSFHNTTRNALVMHQLNYGF